MSGRDAYYEIHIETDAQRVDKAVAELMPEISRSFIQKLIENGEVTVNNIICTSKKMKVYTGDVLGITIPEPISLSVKAEDIPINIVYEDEDVLVINKPKGMVVHPAVGNYTGTLVNALIFNCGERLSSINGVIRPGIVHRIDKDTSGLLVIAKNDSAHKSLAEQLKEHSVTRKYIALVYNNFKEDEGIVNEPIGRDPRNRLRMAVTHVNSKEAVTHYRILERFGKYTLIEAELETGRTHQIRAHMAYIKHPLVGDAVYGPMRNPFNIKGQMLHAGVLGFVHPSTGKYMEFKAPMPSEFVKVLQQLRR